MAVINTAIRVECRKDGRQKFNYNTNGAVPAIEIIKAKEIHLEGINQKVTNKGTYHINITVGEVDEFEFHKPWYLAAVA